MRSQVSHQAAQNTCCYNCRRLLLLMAMTWSTGTPTMLELWSMPEAWSIKTTGELTTLMLSCPLSNSMPSLGLEPSTGPPLLNPKRLKGNPSSRQGIPQGIPSILQGSCTTRLGLQELFKGKLERKQQCLLLPAYLRTQWAT